MLKSRRRKQSVNDGHRLSGDAGKGSNIDLSS